jgi:hypothetical protein
MWLLGIFIIAALAAAVTVGVRTGSLAPYWPSVSRADAPITFWAVIGLCAAVVIANVANLIFAS